MTPERLAQARVIRDYVRRNPPVRVDLSPRIRADELIADLVDLLDENAATVLAAKAVLGEPVSISGGGTWAHAAGFDDGSVR